MKRRGTTLVEMLVVVSIISALFAISLPAVNAARQAARNTERLNWRRQRVLDAPPDRKIPFKVLFVGNSHTYVNDVPGLISEMSKAGGLAEVLTESIVEGGKTLEWHWDSGKVHERLAAGSEPLDFVVLQDQAQQPCANEPAFLECNERFGKLSKEFGAIPLVYMLFERERDCPDGYCPQNTLTNSARRVVKTIQAGDGAGEVSPVGEAWREALNRNPSLKLHQPDGNHSSEAGAYLTACVFYSVIHRMSPKGLPSSFTTSLATVSVTDYDAKILQEVAWEVSEKWRRKTRPWFLK